MGDLLMSTPAITALKTSIGAKITLLTSSKAVAIVSMIPDVDEVIVADLPWVKLGDDPGPELLQGLIAQLKTYAFDGCIIFSVYSQNSLPAALLAYLAGIPLRLAYSRENPYHLLTSWLPDAEPYFYIMHQVERDLNLVATIGAEVKDRHLRLMVKPESLVTLKEKARIKGIEIDKPYMLLHPGVSEERRKYPEELWILTGKELAKELGIQLLITGSAEEKVLTDDIAAGIGGDAHAVGGMFNLEEFAMLIKKAIIVVSVNTATIHLAAAMQTPLVVLYAQSNPQHTPWAVPHRVLEFSVPDELQSRNQVIRYVNDQYYSQYSPLPLPKEVLKAVTGLLNIKV